MNSGFVLLVFMFIERDNPESCWQILHKFNYNKDLQYNYNNQLHLPINNNADKDDNRYELSDSGINYLRKIFIQYDSDHDGKMSYDDIKEMSKISEYENIFYNENILNSDLYLSIYIYYYFFSYLFILIIVFQKIFHFH